MSINILFLHDTVHKLLEKEEKIYEERLELLNIFLLEEQLNLDPYVKKELENAKRENYFIKNTSRSLFFYQTHDLIEEYKQILQKPMTHIKKDNLPLLKRKNELIIKFLDIVRDLVKIKNWTDIEIPSNPKSENIDDFYCENCDNLEENKFELDEFNRKTCLNCSIQQNIIETGITHKDYRRVNVVGKFIYNRVLHFQDCIKQYQGKQNSKIPEKLYKDLDQKFKSHRLLIPNTEKNIKYSKITRNHIIMFLKELKYTKHYENANLIYYSLSNKYIDDISHLEECIINDFKELIILYDEIYGKDRPGEVDRKNFMNAQYILFQLLRRHNHPCEKENFTILKTLDRKLFHDTTCKNLFDKLNWKFTPTF